MRHVFSMHGEDLCRSAHRYVGGGGKQESKHLVGGADALSAVGGCLCGRISWDAVYAWTEGDCMYI